MNQPHSITIVLSFGTTPQNLYAAWTQPAIMRRWMGQSVEADVRVGGRYRNQLSDGAGGFFVHAGEYLVLEPGLRVVQTFLAGSAEPVAGDEYRHEFIEARFRETSPSQTELVFTNGWDGDALDESAEKAVREAWSSWLHSLERAL